MNRLVFGKVSSSNDDYLQDFTGIGNGSVVGGDSTNSDVENVVIDTHQATVVPIPVSEGRIRRNSKISQDRTLSRRVGNKNASENTSI